MRGQNYLDGFVACHLRRDPVALHAISHHGVSAVDQKPIDVSMEYLIADGAVRPGLDQRLHCGRVLF
jgi:hypothetical protein